MVYLNTPCILLRANLNNFFLPTKGMPQCNAFSRPSVLVNNIHLIGKGVRASRCLQFAVIISREVINVDNCVCLKCTIVQASPREYPGRKDPHSFFYSFKTFMLLCEEIHPSRPFVLSRIHVW